MCQHGMGIEFQPHICAEVRQGAHGGGKTHRLANAASPMRGVAQFTWTAVAGHGAEKWNGAWLRLELGERGQEYSWSARSEDVAADRGWL